MRKFLNWLKAPFYKLEGAKDLDGILIALMAFLAIIMFLLFRNLIL
ncbi:MAG: hypothetical protein GQ553_01540 [Nitrosomonadaceae bacterium]|nr:hypothetical protein [Nitrosomonadaceae bacterium]